MKNYCKHYLENWTVYKCKYIINGFALEMHWISETKALSVVRNYYKYYWQNKQFDIRCIIFSVQMLIFILGGGGIYKYSYKSEIHWMLPLCILEWSNLKQKMQCLHVRKDFFDFTVLNVTLFLWYVTCHPIFQELVVEKS